MRLLLTALLCILLAAPAGMEAAAQGFTATPVEVSSEKVNVKGTVYYLHKVLKGQTLYSISKAYGVSQDIITGANPALADGLKAGMLLYIPEAAAAASMTADTAAVATGTADTVRTVSASKETSKSGNLRSRIDKNRKKAEKQEKKYRKYNVKWYETLDDVAVKFNVTREAIIALNGIDTGSDKRIRSVLIPDEEYMRTFRPGEQENEPAIPVREDNTPADQDVISDILADGTGNDLPAVTPGESYTSGTYTISIVLPFNASRLTSGLNAYTADFYAGVLTAMADLKEQGLFSNFVLSGVRETLEHVIESPFEHMTYTDAVKILEKHNDRFEFPVKWGVEIQSEHERFLTEEIAKRPVIVTDYPKDIKAFYMKMNDDGKTVRAMDVLAPRLGEIIGGSEREYRLDVLKERMKELGLDESAYWWYLDLRRYGSVPHSGFGLGFERAVQYVTGVANIRDVIPYPRYVKSCEY